MDDTNFVLKIISIKLSITWINCGRLKMKPLKNQNFLTLNNFCYFLGVDLDHISAEAEKMFETSMYDF